MLRLDKAMKLHAKTIARGLPRWISQHRPSETIRLIVKSHESSLFHGLLTHLYFFRAFFEKKTYLWKKENLFLEIVGKAFQNGNNTWQTSHGRGKTFDASFSPCCSTSLLAQGECIIQENILSIPFNYCAIKAESWMLIGTYRPASGGQLSFRG